MRFPELENERLLLKEIGQQHTGSLFEILSKEEVARNDGIERLTRMDEARSVINSFRISYLNRRGLRWGVILKETGRFIGTVGLNHLNETNKRAEIGYEIHPDYWRNHFTYEAVVEVLRFSYEELGLNRVAAVTFTDNHASANLLKKVGFKEEGVLRGYIFLHGHSHDVKLFSLLKDEASLMSED